MTRLLFILFLASSCAAYSVSDLPVGWDWDVGRVQGEILPPVASGEASDPNTWLVPMGQFVREGLTNQYVSEIRVIETSASVGVFLRSNEETKLSESWEVQGWSISGPWYIVVEAVSPRGKNGQVKTRRYTIVGAGYMPDDGEPELD